MTALKGAEQWFVTAALNKMAETMSYTIPQTLNAKDVFEAFVRPEDREPIVRAVELLNDPGDELSSNVTVKGTHKRSVNIRYTCSPELRFMLPSYAAKEGMHNEAPAIVKEKIYAYVRRANDIKQAFQSAMDAFHTLNAAGSGPALLFFMPALLAVVSSAEKAPPRLIKKFENWSRAKLKSRFPVLPVKVLEDAKQASTVITQGLLAANAPNIFYDQPEMGKAVIICL